MNLLEVKNLKTVKLAEDLWAIEQDFVRCFFIKGAAGSLLIDSCMSGQEALKEALKSALKEAIGTLPGGGNLQMSCTHTDGDHIGGFGRGDMVYVHPAEYEHLGSHEFEVRPLWDGTVFSVGNRNLHVKLLPGHTPGNVAFIDDENKVIFIGDTVSDSAVYMFGEGRNLEAYIASLELLASEYSGYGFYCCHGSAKLPAGALTSQLECAKKLFAGELEGEKPPFDMPCKLYKYGGAAILY
jgi:glyoxylase-like metal-dependent hydrolase (beta-lactamase superfamily II)